MIYVKCTHVLFSFIYPWLRGGLLKSFIGSQANKNAIIYHKTVMAPTGSYWVGKDKRNFLLCVLHFLRLLTLYILTSQSRYHSHIIFYPLRKTSKVKWSVSVLEICGPGYISTSSWMPWIFSDFFDLSFLKILILDSCPPPNIPVDPLSH